MSTTTDFDRAARAWLDDGPTQLSDRTLDAALAEIHLTRQRRAMRAPWRDLHMPALSRATAIAAVALAAVVGTGAFISVVSSGRPSGPGGPPTAVPTPTLDPAPSSLTIGWRPYVSSAYSFEMLVPPGWTSTPATRTWEIGDRFPADADEFSYADVFMTAEQGDAQIAMFVWQMPAWDESSIRTSSGIRAWADRFCTEVGVSACDQFTQPAENLCRGPSSCQPAIIVPTADGQYAFFETVTSGLLSEREVQVVVVARPDDFPGAARYGGSVALLRAVLTSMNVWPVGQQPSPG